MDVYKTLATRNADFAAQNFMPGLRMMPALRAMVIGCVDPRVDPAVVLGAHQGELVVIRNVGGRITPQALDELAMLRSVSQAAGGDLGAGWEIIVLHHTDCGITRLVDHPAMLGAYFGIAESGVASAAVADPFAAVARDVQAVRDETRLGAGIHVSGLVYDVGTGRVETVVRP